MNIRSFALPLAVCAAVMASAQAGVVQAMAGRGVARGEGSVAKFSVHAVKNAEGQIRAGFSFLAETREPHRRILIELIEPRGFHTRENTGVIEGPGLMKVRDAQGVHEFRGQLRIQGFDLVHNPPGDGRDAKQGSSQIDGFKLDKFGLDDVIGDAGADRKPGGRGEHVRLDKLAVRFTNPEHHITYNFEGVVGRGFIEVRGAHN